MITEHDKERIFQAAEEFYNLLAAPEDGITDVSLDHFVIVGVTAVSTDDDEENEMEVPVMYGSSRRIFVQRGILETMLDLMKRGGVGAED